MCIYHGNCDDGFGAAWAIWRAWPKCEFFAGFYGMDLPELSGKHVLFVDFSAKRPVIDAIAQTAKTIVIIDHHKTAEADLEPFKVTMCGSPVLHPGDIQHMFRDLNELDRPPIIAWFDMDQSGAAMAWQFANGAHRDEEPIPTMLEYIEDRDLWRFAYEDRTREFSAALRTYPMDFNVWDKIAEDPRPLVEEGKIVLRAHRANIQKLMRETYTETIGGFAVPVVNAPYHYASDTAHELLAAYPDAPFAACWFRRADGQIQWSLRSEDHRQDVSEIAKARGGGGHRNAAGFQSPAPSPTQEAAP
ncbi:phosphohydrolase [Rhizobium leguminosarum]|nr:phosphohydrolase [Rhizobium leguminosarum]